MTIDGQKIPEKHAGNKPAGRAPAKTSASGKNTAGNAQTRLKQPVDKRVKALRAAMLVVVCMLIAVPVLCMNHEQDIVSDIDNRHLQNFPQRHQETTFTQQVESYYSDRIGFRKEMIGAYSLLNDKAFHLMTHPLYEYGDDGYVYFKFHDEPYDSDFLAAFADYIKVMQDFCLVRDIPFLYVITPEKTRIYPEHIPSSVGPIPSSSDLLKPLLDERGINYIDLGDALLQAKNEGREVFNRVYDAGHWNSEGMYAGSQMIVDKLQEMGFDIADINLDDYHKEYERQTTLPASFYPIDETTFKYQINPNVEYAAKDYCKLMEEVESDKNYHTCSYYKTSLPQNITMLMFQGSYFNTQSTMLKNEFSTFATIHDYLNVFFLPYYIDVFQPDVVIFENADYTVADNYYPLEMFEYITFPEPYSAYESYTACPLNNSYLTVDFNPNSNFTSLYTTWPGRQAITSLYVEIDGVMYDTIPLEDSTFKWGITTDVLSNAVSITFYGIDANSNTQYVASGKIR